MDSQGQILYLFAGDGSGDGKSCIIHALPAAGYRLQAHACGLRSLLIPKQDIDGI